MAIASLRYKSVTPLIYEGDIRVPVADVGLSATLSLPADAAGVIIAAFGSDTGRYSARTRFLMEEMVAAGFATLLVDLLSEEEEKKDRKSGRLRRNYGFLSGRLVRVTEWVSRDEALGAYSAGYFVSGDLAAPAFASAARVPSLVKAIVVRGGRPDLAGGVVGVVEAPTLLVAGELDPHVSVINQQAMRKLRCVRSLRVLPGVSHNFEQEGAMEEVAALASDWFKSHLRCDNEKRARDGNEAEDVLMSEPTEFGASCCVIPQRRA